MSDLARQVIEQAIATKQAIRQLEEVDMAEAQALAPGTVDADLCPSAGAGIAIALTRYRSREEGREPKANAVYKSVAQRCQEVKSGNLGLIDEMLVSQCHTLNSVFNQLVGDAALSKNRDARAEYLRLALQAQNQCQKSLRVLADIHAPKRGATFIKSQQNTLIQEIAPNAPMEQRSAIEAGPGDQTVEALAKKHRAKVPRR